MIKVLFLCTGNSCRSQMAEGWTRYLKRDQIEAYSAGTRPQGLNPLAVEVMAESGIDISQNHSKHVADLLHLRFDYVVTVCDSAQKSCPIFPGESKIIHRGFDDPPKLAESVTTEEDVLRIYRRVRDEIRDYVLTIPKAFNVA